MGDESVFDVVGRMLFDSSQADAALEKTSGALDGLAKNTLPATGAATSSLDGQMKSLTTSLVGSVIGFTSLVGAGMAAYKLMGDIVSSAAEAETAEVLLAQSLLSTGRGAEISSAQIGMFADALMKTTNFDDESIKAAFTAINKFESLPTDKMEAVVTLAADMSAAFGGDLSSNATQIARVLETGVIPRTWAFSTALKAQIREQIAAGDSGGALVLIMDELTRRYGGTAIALMGTYAGQTKAVGTAWGEVKEALGASSIALMENSGLLPKISNALYTVADKTNAVTQAQKAGVDIVHNYMLGLTWVNGHLVTHEELLKVVELAQAGYSTNVEVTNESIAKLTNNLSANKGSLEALRGTSLEGGSAWDVYTAAIIYDQAELDRLYQTLPPTDKALSDMNERLSTVVATTDTATVSYDMFGLAIVDTNSAMQQAGQEYASIISFAKQYETGVTNIETASDNLSIAQQELLALIKAKWPEGSAEIKNAREKVEEMSGALGVAEKAAQDATNEMIAGFLQAQLTADGAFTEDDIRKVLDYRLAVGLLTDEAYAAALESLHIAQNLASIPKLTEAAINITTNHYDNYYTDAPRTTQRLGDPAQWMGAGGPIEPNSYLWNESASSTPEVFVSGGGYILTKQDAMAALGGSGGGGNNITFNIDGSKSPMEVAREIAQLLRLNGIQTL